MAPITLLIAEDHALVREGTRELLARHADLQVLGETDRGDRAVELVETLRPQVALLDLRLPGLNGIEATARIRKRLPEVKVIILSAYDDEHFVAAALRAGATGYLCKTAPGRAVADAVRAAHRGETVLQPALAAKLARYWQGTAIEPRSDRLTGRELEVLRLLARGRCNKDIAATLGVSLRTVEGHLSNIFSKLGVTSRTEAVLQAIQRHLLPLDEMTTV